VDLILGADVFYSRENYAAVLSTVASLMEENAEAIFVTTYQERSTHRNIQPFLDLYGMVAELLPIPSASVSVTVAGDGLSQSPTSPYSNDLFLIRIVKRKDKIEINRD
jgi:predicted nicotinamide N-methyase